MSETHILLVRHPETLANVDGRFVGRGDVSFTACGQRQLRRIPAKVAAFRPDTVLSSPLRRARVLAERIRRRTGVDLRIDDRLMELDFGDAEGMTYEQITAAGMVFDYRNLHAPVAPGGESRAQIEARAAAVCDELVSTSGRYAIVTHGGVFRASLIHVLGLDSTDVWAFHIRNGQLAYVRVVDGHGMLEEYLAG